MPQYLSLKLHHYTSGTGLIGIFNSDSIWATKIHYMNDSKEFAHATELAMTALRELRHGHKGDQYAKLCAALSDHLGYLSQLALYVACFSEVEDSLSQWRGYCPPSFGYSVGFDRTLLEQVAAKQGFVLQPCIYNRDHQVQKVNAWAREALAVLNAGFPPEVDPNVYVTANCSEFLNKFIAFAPFMKDSSFQDEREWRLVGLVPSDDPRLALRPGRSLLVPYLPIKLDAKTESSPVWNICVGPTPHIELAGNSLTHLLHTVKIRNGITRSIIPYRDW